MMVCIFLIVCLIAAGILLGISSRCASQKLDQKTWERIEGWRK